MVKSNETSNISTCRFMRRSFLRLWYSVSHESAKGLGVQDFPHALGAGESMTVYAPPGTDENPALAHASRAFVRTAAGLTFCGRRGEVSRHLAQHRTA